MIILPNVRSLSLLSRRRLFFLALANFAIVTAATAPAFVSAKNTSTMFTPRRPQWTDPSTDQGGVGGLGTDGRPINPTGPMPTGPGGQPVPGATVNPVQPPPPPPPPGPNRKPSDNYPGWFSTFSPSMDQAAASTRFDAAAMGVVMAMVNDDKISMAYAALQGADGTGATGPQRVNDMTIDNLSKGSSMPLTCLRTTGSEGGIDAGGIVVEPPNPGEIGGGRGVDGELYAFWKSNRPIDLDGGEFIEVSVPPPGLIRNGTTGRYQPDQKCNLNIRGNLKTPADIWVTVVLLPIYGKDASMKPCYKFAFAAADAAGSRLFRVSGAPTPGGTTGDGILKESDVVLVDAGASSPGTHSFKQTPDHDGNGVWTFGVYLTGETDGLLHLDSFKSGWAPWGIQVSQVVFGGGAVAGPGKDLSGERQIDLVAGDGRILYISLSVPLKNFAPGCTSHLILTNIAGTGASVDKPILVTVSPDGKDEGVAGGDNRIFHVRSTEENGGTGSDAEFNFGSVHQGPQSITRDFILSHSAFGTIQILNSNVKIIGKDARYFGFNQFGSVQGDPARVSTVAQILGLRQEIDIQLVCTPQVAGELEAQVEIGYKYETDAETAPLRKETIDIVAGSSPFFYNQPTTGDNLNTGVFNPLGGDTGVAGGNPLMASNTPALALMFAFRHTQDADIQLAAYTTALMLWTLGKPSSREMWPALVRYKSYYESTKLGTTLEWLFQQFFGAVESVLPTPAPGSTPSPDMAAVSSTLEGWMNDWLSIRQKALDSVGAGQPLAPGDMKWLETIVRLGFEALNKGAPHTAAGPGFNTAVADAVDPSGTLGAGAEAALWGLNVAKNLLKSAGQGELAAVANAGGSLIQGLNTWVLSKIKKIMVENLFGEAGIRRPLMVPRGFITSEERDEQILAAQSGMASGMGIPGIGTGVANQNFPRGAGVWTDIVPTVVKPSQLSGITYWTPPAGGNAPGSNAASGQGVMGGGLGSVPSNYNLMDPQALYQLAGLNPIERLLFMNGRLASLPHRPGDVDSVLAAVKKQQGQVFNRSMLATAPPFWVHPAAQTLPMTQYKQWCEKQEQALAAQLDERVIGERIRSIDEQKSAAVEQRKRFNAVEQSKFSDVPRKRRFLNVHAVAPFHNLNPLDVSDPQSVSLFSRAFVPARFPDA